MAVNPLFRRIRVLVRGGGDLGSGVVCRLVQAGFPVLVTELAQPLFVRRTVSYGSAVYEGSITIEGITAVRVESVSNVDHAISQGNIPVLVDPDGMATKDWTPAVVVDARMAKQPLDTTINQAVLVVALGPGFEVGVHCHAVVETNRGHFLGRVYWNGHAEADTGLPGSVGGVTAQRVLRAPVAGTVTPRKQIGDRVLKGEIVATVGGEPVQAAIDGVLRGIIHPAVEVSPGLKIGDVDPRADPSHCFSISEKSLAVGGGVLAAVLMSAEVRAQMLGGGSAD